MGGVQRWWDCVVVVRGWVTFPSGIIGEQIGWSSCFLVELLTLGCFFIYIFFQNVFFADYLIDND